MTRYKTEEKVNLLNNWLTAEDQTIEMTNNISKSTDNETIKIFMDIIRTDSAKHKRIQSFLVDAMTKQAPALDFGEIADISQMINDHLALEQKTVDLGMELAKEEKLPVIKELLEYLLEDEEKHVKLLNALSDFKQWAQQNT